MRQLTFTLKVIRDAIHKVGITVPSRPVVPVCEMVNIKTRNGKVTVFTSDTSASTCISVPYEGDGDVDFNVNHSDLNNYLKICDAENVLFKIENNLLKVEGDNDQVVFRIDHEPHLQDCCEVTGKIYIPELDIGKIYKNLVQFASTNEQLETHISGIFLDGDGEKVTAVSTNRHVVAVWDFPLKLKGQYLLPKSFVKAMYNFYSEDMTVDFTDPDCIIESGSIQFRTLLVDAKFVDYRSALTQHKGMKYYANFGVQSLLGVVQKAMLFADYYNKLTMIFGEGNAKVVTGNSEIGNEYDALVDCDNNLPQNYRIGINAGYLKGVLSCMDSEKVKVEFSEPNNAMFFTDQEGNFFMVLPVMVDV